MRPSRLSKLHVESTGDPALDAILGGGIPARSMIVVAGQPGSGKTVLTLQMLFRAARRGKRCIYFTTLSEPAVKLIQFMQLFSFFDEGLLDDKLLFVDLGAAVRAGGEQVVGEIVARVESFGAELIAIDSFKAIDDGRAQGRRPAVYDLAVQIAALGATSLLLGEYEPADQAKFAEFAVADGIVRLGSQELGLTSIRELEVLKLRGAAYVSGRHFCEITSDGFAVYPRVRAPEQEPQATAPVTGRSPTGVAGLDDMLEGGLLRGSTTVVRGPTGVGKTILGLQFLLEGARRGEKGILFTLEETPDQLVQIAASLGLELNTTDPSGLITVLYTSPVELSTDRFLFQARAIVQRLAPARAVFDGLTSMALGVSSDRRFKELVYAISKHLRRAGTTVLMTAEAEARAGSAKAPGSDVSFLADALIALTYRDDPDGIARAISVVKARGTAHAAGARPLAIGPGGARIEGRAADGAVSPARRTRQPA
jgi:circadian clock protein KaiC